MRRGRRRHRCRAMLLIARGERERRDISLHLSSLCEKPKASNSQWTTSLGGPDADAVGGMFMAAEANFGGLAEEDRREAERVRIDLVCLPAMWGRTVG